MQSPKRLVGCIEVSGRRRADSSSHKSDSYNLSVSEKKREEYCRAIPQNCRALYLFRSTGSRVVGPHFCGHTRGLDCAPIPFWVFRLLALHIATEIGSLPLALPCAIIGRHRMIRVLKACGAPKGHVAKFREMNHRALAAHQSFARLSRGRDGPSRR